MKDFSVHSREDSESKTAAVVSWCAPILYKLGLDHIDFNEMLEGLSCVLDKQHHSCVSHIQSEISGGNNE